MGGYEHWNYPTFNAYADLLREQGAVVLNPAETAGGRTDMPRAWYMEIDFGYLHAADEVLLLPGWRLSAGAKLEALIATQMHKKVSELVPNHEAGILATRDVFLDLKNTELLERSQYDEE
jgi:hypothetical protein